LIVQPDEALRVDRLERQTHMHQSRVRQHKDDEVHGLRHATDHHPAHLAGVHLALNAGHHVENRLVVARLGKDPGFLEQANIAPQAALRDGHLTELRRDLAGKLHVAQPREALNEIFDVGPRRIQASAPTGVQLGHEHIAFAHAQILANRIPGDAQLLFNGANG
jgi:hypothetical protein